MRDARRAWLLVAGLLVAVACGVADDSLTGEPDPSWAGRAVELTTVMADAYDAEDEYTSALFYTAGGTLDLTIWEQGIATTPDEVVEALRRIWWHSGRPTTVRAEHLFVSTEGAIIWWRAHELEGFQHWAQTYAFFGGRTASRAFRALEAPFEWTDVVEQRVVDVYDRYLVAWATGDAASLEAVYAADATVRDPVRGTSWNGIDEIASQGAEPLESGPWPELFTYSRVGQVEAVALVQSGGECPMLGARRWIIVDGAIIDETRYVHVPSARRCLLTPPEGWWTSFEPVLDYQDNVTEIVDVNGLATRLVNAEPIHEEFVRWMSGEFVAAGLPPADVSVIWFPPSPDCGGRGPSGLAHFADRRFEDDSTVLLCYGADDLGSSVSTSGWSRIAATVGFHELAHIWMHQHLDDETRSAFVARTGVEAWRGDELAWDERGIEHAATTIAWGLGGTADAVHLDLEPPDCDEIAARYELLTGRRPATECGPEGWAP